MGQILVVGATGMTGQPVVEQLLNKGHQVRVVVRSREKLSPHVSQHPNLSVKEASLLDLSDAEMITQVRDCDAIISCLGHVLSFKGMFGQPRKLCTDAVRRLGTAVEKTNPPQPVKFILMNTVGVKNPGGDPKRTLGERALLSVLRHTIPPHNDNETAAEHLHRTVGKNNPHIQWAIVRPDTLINADVSAYDIEPAPTTGIFTGRPTTRANVAHFMVALTENAELWAQWKFKTPVIMNALT